MTYPALAPAPSLRITVELSAEGREEAVFQRLWFGRITELTRCATADLGLRALAGDPPPTKESEFGLPSPVAAVLADAFLTALPHDRPLWIDFPSPRGYLPLVPWERLLPLPNAVLRAPLHRLRPCRAPGPLVVAVIACPAYPEATDGVVDASAVIVQRYESLPQPPVVLVFGTPAFMRNLSKRVGKMFGVPLRETDPPAEDETLSDAFLRTVRTAMSGRSVDCVHFVGDAYQSGARGSIAIPTLPPSSGRAYGELAHPTDAPSVSSRLVDTPEFGRFLTQVGAWSTILTTPRRAASATALRAFASEIAENRTGVAMVHELLRDPDCHQLGIGFERLVFAGDDDVEPNDWFAALPAVTYWGAPMPIYRNTGRPPWDDAPDLNSDSTSKFIGDSTRRASRTQWVAAAIRSLEKQQVDWLPDDHAPGADPAAINALSAIGALIERYAPIEPDTAHRRRRQ